MIVGQSLLQGISAVALQEQMLRIFIPHSLEIGNESCCLKSRILAMSLVALNQEVSGNSQLY